MIVVTEVKLKPKNRGYGVQNNLTFKLQTAGGALECLLALAENVEDDENSVYIL